MHTAPQTFAEMFPAYVDAMDMHVVALYEALQEAIDWRCQDGMPTDALQHQLDVVLDEMAERGI